MPFAALLLRIPIGCRDGSACVFERQVALPWPSACLSVSPDAPLSICSSGVSTQTCATALRPFFATRARSFKERPRECFLPRSHWSTRPARLFFRAQDPAGLRDPHHGAVDGGGRLRQDRGMEREGERAAAGRVRGRVDGRAGGRRPRRPGLVATGHGARSGQRPERHTGAGGLSLAGAPAHARFPAPAPGPIWTAVSHYGPLFGPLWATLSHHFGPLCATLCHFVPLCATLCRHGPENAGLKYRSPSRHRAPPGASWSQA